MKKAITGILIALTSVFLIITGIFFVRRNQPDGDILRTVAEQTLCMASEETVPPSTVAAPKDTRININTATAQELTALPGIGPVLAERIVAYRDTHGPYTQLTDLMKVDGIGTKRMEQLLDLITLGG